MTDATAGSLSTLKGPTDYSGLRRQVLWVRHRTDLSVAVRTLIHAATGALAATIVVETAIWLLRWLAPDALAGVFNWVPAGQNALVIVGLWVAAACAAVLLATFGGQAWGRRRSLSSVAGDIDRRLGLAERIATAIEVGEKAPAGGSIVRLLHAVQLKDTLDAVADADFRRAEPDLVPPRSWIVAPLIALALALAFGFGPQPELSVSSRSAQTAQTGEVLTTAERESAAQRLTEIAALLRSVPNESRAAFTEALARTADSVSSDLKAEPVTRGDLARRLESLAKAVDSAFSSGSSGTLDRVAAALQQQITDLKSRSVGTQQEAASTGRTPQSSSDTPSQGNSSPGATATPPRTDQSAKVAMPASEGHKPPSGDYYQADPELLARQQQEAAQMRPLSGGVPAGGAQNASRGGNQAGEGVKAIAGAPLADDISRAAQRKADDVVLPQQDAGLGERIRISVVPPAAGNAIPGIGGGPDGNWHAAPEAPVDRPTLAPGQLSLLVSYYAPSDIGD